MIRRIRSFVIENYLFGDESKLGNDASFMEGGIIDSTGILELVRYLESTFSIKVADDELTPDNLDSVNKILSFVRSKLAASSNEIKDESFHHVER